MGYYKGLNPLRDILADLYPVASIAQVVIEEAGIAAQWVDFNGRAIEFWQSALTTAQNNGQVQGLINVARKHFPNNITLQDAEKTFLKAPVPPAPDMSEDSQESDSNSGDTTNNVDGGNSGILIGGDAENSTMVNVGDVSGSYNAFGSNNSVIIGGTPADGEPPSLERFRLMLEELQTELGGTVDQPEQLGQIDAAAPHMAKGALAQIQEVVKDIQTESSSNEKTIAERLRSASGLLDSITEKTKSVAQNATEVGKAATQVLQQLTPILPKLTLAITWAAKLWPG